MLDCAFLPSSSLLSLSLSGMPDFPTPPPFSALQTSSFSEPQHEKLRGFQWRCKGYPGYTSQWLYTSYPCLVGFSAHCLWRAFLSATNSKMAVWTCGQHWNGRKHQQQSLEAQMHPVNSLWCGLSNPKATIFVVNIFAFTNACTRKM